MHTKQDCNIVYGVIGAVQSGRSMQFVFPKSKFVQNLGDRKCQITTSHAKKSWNRWALHIWKLHHVLKHNHHTNHRELTRHRIQPFTRSNLTFHFPKASLKMLTFHVNKVHNRHRNIHPEKSTKPYSNSSLEINMEKVWWPTWRVMTNLSTFSKPKALKSPLAWCDQGYPWQQASADTVINAHWCHGDQHPEADTWTVVNTLIPITLQSHLLALQNTFRNCLNIKAFYDFSSESAARAAGNLTPTVKPD